MSDLLFRRRQFLIATVGAALVLGMAVVLTGVSASFRDEVARTVDGVGADAWVVPEGASGPFTGLNALSAAVADDVAEDPGVVRADPLIIVGQSAGHAGETTTVNVVAHRPDGLGSPEVVDGRAIAASGEAVVDRRFGAEVGDELTVAGASVTIVGRTTGMSLFGGIPNLYVSFDDAQALVFDSAPLATAIAVQGELDDVAGFKVMTDDEVRSDALRTMADAISTVDSTRAFMWVVAAVIVAGLMFVSALERVRDFAVLKAMGASSRYLFGSVAAQAVVVTLLAALIAAAISTVLAPVFALPVAVPTSAFVALPAVAVVMGLLASLAGLRRAVSVDPALAFAGAAGR